MVLRKLTMALLSIGVMLPGLTHALAVRDIKTKSALCEPFSAEVELTDIGDLTEEDIKVGLAQKEDFERLGIERVYFLTELRFDVVVSGGRSIVKITSQQWAVGRGSNKSTVGRGQFEPLKDIASN